MTSRPPRGRQKPRKDAAQSQLPLKVVVRRLPPNLPENIFHTSIASWHKAIEWSDYVTGKLASSRVKCDIFSRAYLKFRKHADLLDFIKRYHGHPFVSSEGRQFRACAEVAPFQKVPKLHGNSAKSKDSLCGTLDQDPEFLAFQESLKTITPHKKDVEVAPSKITPLIEHLRAQKLKNEAKVKARKAKENLAKSKGQEEKKKTQTQANGTSTKPLKVGTSGKGQQVKNTTNSDAEPKGTDSKQSSKRSSKNRGKNVETDKQGPSINGKTATKTDNQTTKVATVKPSPLAQQRLASKPKNAAINSRPPIEDAKSVKPKKNKKKENTKGLAPRESKSSQERSAPVDISGPTPAEMAALNRGKT
ncbi:protein of unknown function [Taphrina deformans PYCC 5710]|uniref:UPF3 domain-containing protein n=1 Tax=Taphrina deformans (strain PYCC 5710 / ATCC 11124 / CBS 356.35 / IMI 108563 / JCM 9778 / NBRC 8474) TaxID=1097556 RepID=R4XDF6_TAPDE|nr:protein of unknown function [Taphrina deformans PYCC 5710]|eukprot:CCG83911.1 protein of unknown function [Taphrina deformans PYCC 5710]